MTLIFLQVLSALWLGIVTAVSPCPLATNIAAISVLARKAGAAPRALAGAGAYTLGRVVAYCLLAVLLAAGLATMPGLSGFLRQNILPIIGPILILAGMAVVGLLPLPFDFRISGPGTAEKIAGWGLLGEFLLGALFALSFCPVSAALFFGSLMPLALTSTAAPLLVGAYGIGTALPVGVVAVLLVVSSQRAAKALGKIQSAQVLIRNLTGSIIILAGLYLTVFHTILPVLN